MEYCYCKVEEDGKRIERVNVEIVIASGGKES